MYNLYTHEKLTEKLKKSEQEKRSLSLHQKKRKIELKTFSNNYNERLNKFIVKMAVHPRIIKDEPPAVVNSKSQYLREKYPGKIPKRFIFNGFVSEKDRIERLKKTQEENKKYEDIIYTINQEREKRKEINDMKDKIIQPILRFKPRNDIERILEFMTSYSYNKHYEKILKNHLKELDLSEIKRIKGHGKIRKFFREFREKKLSALHNSSGSNASKTLDVENFESYIINQTEDNNDNFSYKFTSIKSLNKEKAKVIKEIVKDYEKLHFKGVKQKILEDNLAWTRSILKSSSTPNVNKKFNYFTPKSNRLVDYERTLKKNCERSLQNIFAESQDDKNVLKKKKDKSLEINRDKYLRELTVPLKKRKELQLKLVEKEKEGNILSRIISKFRISDKNKDLIDIFPLFFNGESKYFTNQSLLDEKKQKESDSKVKDLPQKLTYLEKLNHKMDGIYDSQEKTFPYFVNKFKERMQKLGFSKNDAERINFLKEYLKKTNGGHTAWELEGIYYNNDDLLKLCGQLLRKCNVTRDKSKYNQHNLKEGNGKLSFTSGLSINEFEKKFNL